MPITAYLKRLKEKGYSRDSLRTYRRVLGWFENQTISESSINRFYASIKGLKLSSQLLYLGKLRKYLQEYYPKLLAYAPMPKKPQPLLKNIPDKLSVKKIVQQPDMGSFSGIRDRVILELLYGSGLRRSEVISLKLGDLDLVKHIVRVNAGKGNKDRIVPLSKMAVAWLRRYLDRVRPALHPKTDDVFTSTRTGLALYVSMVNKIVRKYSDYSPHKYRHAYATHLLQNGMQETSLQRLLGHSQLATTQLYMKVTIPELMDAYRKYHPRDRWEPQR